MTTRLTRKNRAHEPLTFSAVQAALLEPHVTEKATTCEQRGTYVFKVTQDASKIDIARAVAERFKVTVQHVRIGYQPAKTRRIGRTIGQKAGYKKAYVTLKKGETIASH